MGCSGRSLVLESTSGLWNRPSYLRQRCGHVGSLSGTVPAPKARETRPHSGVRQQAGLHFTQPSSQIPNPRWWEGATPRALTFCSTRTSAAQPFSDCRYFSWKSFPSNTFQGMRSPALQGQPHALLTRTSMVRPRTSRAPSCTALGSTQSSWEADRQMKGSHTSACASQRQGAGRGDRAWPVPMHHDPPFPPLLCADDLPTRRSRPVPTPKHSGSKAWPGRRPGALLSQTFFQSEARDTKSHFRGRARCTVNTPCCSEWS